MGRRERQEAAKVRRLALRRAFEMAMTSALEEMRGTGTIPLSQLWRNFLGRLDLHHLVEDQMAIQELSVYKRDFERSVKAVIDARRKAT